MPQLILRAGLPGAQSFVLTQASTSLGRTDDNGIRIDHQSISKRHAQLDFDDASVTVVDLGSKNGTFVNGQRIERRQLVPGDLLRFGDVTLLFAGEDATAHEASLMMTVNLDRHRTRAPFQELLARPAPKHDDAGDANPMDAAERAQSRLEILLRVSQLLSSPEAIDTLLAKILDLVFQILDVDRAAILLVDGAGKLEPRVVKSSLPLQAGEKIWSRNIVDYVREHSVGALFFDARSDARLDDALSVIAGAICSSMCAPLKPRDQVTGVLYVDKLSVPTRFAAEDLDFLTAFANQAAIAIENSLLHARLEDEAVMRNNLLRFFPPATIKRLMAPSSAGLGTIDAEVTALFADLSNFTAMSSTMEPRAILDLLNEYFPVMAEIVFRHEGTLEKYIGDALLAVWGAPFAHPEDAERAVAAACEMQRALHQLNAGWRAAGRPELQMHIGLNTGRVAAGNIGSERFIQYATIGDATNVASRVCSVAGEGEILLAEATATRLTSSAQTIERLPPVSVKGKEEPLTLHRLRWQRP